MPELRTELRVVARVRVIPGPVTIGIRAAQGEHWCECHGWHHRDAFRCPAEKAA